MSRICQIFFASICIGGLFTVVVFARNAQWWAALSVFCLMATLTLWIYLGPNAFKDHLWLPALPIAALIAGIASVLTQTEVTNQDLTGSYAGIIADLEHAGSSCGTQNQRLETLRRYMLVTCISKPNEDQTKLAFELAKALYLSEGGALADNVVAANEHKPVNRCAHAYREAFKLCPSGFPSVNKAEREALLKAAE